jgi:H+/Cl- antiporter ClcA
MVTWLYLIQQIALSFLCTAAAASTKGSVVHDCKTWPRYIGFSISESLTRNLQRLAILLLIGALATFITWLMGILTELKQWHRRYQSNTNKIRRVLSTFFIGCEVAKENRLSLKWREYENTLFQVRCNALAQSLV